MLSAEAVIVKSGLRDLRVLKTTQSSFVDFVQDEYTTLTDAPERIFRYLKNLFALEKRQAKIGMTNAENGLQNIGLVLNYVAIYLLRFLFYSTIVEAEWTYDNMKSADFDNAWLTVKDAILEKFAGPPDTGVYSPSVQHTLYQAEKTVLEKVSEVSFIFLTQMIKI